MPYRKRSSPVLDKAERRLSSLKSIDSALDLGSGLTLQFYSDSIETARQRLAAYNTMLSNLTQTYNEMLAAEQILADLNMRMLTGVLTKYGKNSTEYEMAGGKRTKQKRSAKAAVTSTASVISSSGESALASSVNLSQNGNSNGARSTVR
jgi:hypothetical protein